MASSRARLETAVICALINSGDAHLGVGFGLRPEQFEFRQAEFRWITDYQTTYGQCPTGAGLVEKFPGFNFDRSIVDVPLYAEDFMDRVDSDALKRAIRDAATYISEGDKDAARMSLGPILQPVRMQKPLSNALDDLSFLDTYHDREDVLEWPWASMQMITSGHRLGELYYLAARLGQGKSWSLTCMIGNALLAGRDVLMYSLEMPEIQVKQRMHVYLGARLGYNVDHTAMRNRDFDLIKYRKLARACAEEVPGKLYIQDTSKGAISPTSLIGGQNREVDLVVVDHVGLMHTPSGGRAVEDWRAMAIISNSLKEVAMSQNIRVLGAAQINREGDNEKEMPPKVKNLAQSDALGQDADTVVTFKRWGTTSTVYSIEKTRDGHSGVPFWTKFEPNEGEFSEISREQADERKERDLDRKDAVQFGVRAS